MIGSTKTKVTEVILSMTPDEAVRLRIALGTMTEGTIRDAIGDSDASCIWTPSELMDAAYAAYHELENHV